MVTDALKISFSVLVFTGTPDDCKYFINIDGWLGVLISISLGW